MGLVIYLLIIIPIVIIFYIYEKVSDPFRASKEEENVNLRSELQKSKEANRKLNHEIESRKSENEKRIDELRKRYK